MASISHFYSDDTFSSFGFSQFPYHHQLTAATTTASSSGEITNYGGEYTGTDSSGGGGAVPIWGAEESSFPMISYDNVFAPDQSHAVSRSPPPMMMQFPANEELGPWDSAVPTTALAEYNNNMAMCGGINNDIHNFGARFHQPPSSDVYEFGDDCCSYMHHLKPMYASTGENWGIQHNQMPSIIEDGNVIKVGRYSVEERKDRILRYLKKKNQRNFNKTIKYACRKTLAERRVRIRGRFARNNEMCDEEVGMKNDDHSQKDKNLYCEHDDDDQIKQDEEWLQEAMASLMYVPYISG